MGLQRVPPTSTVPHPFCEPGAAWMSIMTPMPCVAPHRIAASTYLSHPLHGPVDPPAEISSLRVTCVWVKAVRGSQQLTVEVAHRVAAGAAGCARSTRGRQGSLYANRSHACCSGGGSAAASSPCAAFDEGRGFFLSLRQDPVTDWQPHGIRPSRRQPGGAGTSSHQGALFEAPRILTQGPASKASL